MLRSKKFWAYEPSQKLEIKQEIFDNYKIKGKFYEDAQYFYDTIGVAPHPGLKFQINKDMTELNSLSLINNRVDKNTIKILTHLLPYTRITSLKFCSNDFDIDNLELLINNLLSKSNNVFYLSFDWNDKLVIKESDLKKEVKVEEAEEEKKKEENSQDKVKESEKSSKKLKDKIKGKNIDKDKEKNKDNEKEKNKEKIIEEQKINNDINESNNNIKDLNFLGLEQKLFPVTVSRTSNEANDVFKIVFNRFNDLIYKLFINTKFEGICLRCNFLGDDVVNEIFKIMANPDNNSQIRILSLYKNNLTSKCIDEFCSMLLKNKMLEEINLGGNNFVDEDLIKLKNHLGKFPMTLEEVEEYNRKVKERDIILAKNVKLKLSKKPEMEVPILDEVTQIGEQFFIVKNTSLKVLNISENNFTKNCFDSIKSLLDYNDNLFITVDNNLFDEANKNILTDTHGKYYNKIYFSKINKS